MTYKIPAEILHNRVWDDMTDKCVECSFYKCSKVKSEFWGQIGYTDECECLAFDSSPHDCPFLTDYLCDNEELGD